MKYFFIAFFFIISGNALSANRDCSTALSDCNAQNGSCTLNAAQSSVYWNNGLTYFSSCPLSSVTCDASATFNASTNSCTCPSGQEMNSFGICGAPESCPSNTWRNPVTRFCDPKPDCYANGSNYNVLTNSCVYCAASEWFNSVTGACVLSPLKCPKHFHPNATNDGCLKDPPLTCPDGKHDDGTYTCIADDATGCTDGQTRGFIDGQLQCIPKKHSDESTQAAADLQAEADAAKAASDADPDNQSLKDAADAAQAKADKAKETAGEDKSTESVQTLREIKDLIKDLYDDMFTTPDEFDAEPMPEDEVIEPDLPDVSGGVGGCPANPSVGLRGGTTLTLPLENICSFAEAIHNMVIALSYLIAARILANGSAS